MARDIVSWPALYKARRFPIFVVLLLSFGSLHITLATADSIVVENECTLADAIESANQDRAIGGCAAASGADIIELTSDIKLVAELPAITSPIAIMGGGFAISGDLRFRIFFVSKDGDLIIDSLRLHKGAAQADTRTCIDWQEGIWTAGGAICNLGKLGISESHFRGNVAEFGGAIASVGTVTIVDSDFSGNSANGGGAIISWGDSVLTVTGSDFDGNAAKTTGALLDSQSSEDDDSSEDSDVRIAVDPVYYDGYGGAIANSLGGEVTITETTFHNNVADLGAGAILDHGTTEIIDCQFTSNSTSYGGGGAIESRMGTVTVTGSVFSGNSAYLGGAVYSWGTLTIDDSRYSENSAVRGGAIHTSSYTILTITGSKFGENAASDSGGVIFNWVGGLLTATDSVFSGNSANFRGGAIFGYGTLQVSGSLFRRNSAGDLGGAIINEGTLTVTDSEFSENSASSGGGIYNPPDGVLRQVGNNFSDNRGGDCEGCD